MTILTTATLAPFAHATEHPDYVATKEARRMASAADDEAQRDYWITCEVIAEAAVASNKPPTDHDRQRLDEQRAKRDAARQAYDLAATVWWETRVRLGLEDAR